MQLPCDITLNYLLGEEAGPVPVKLRDGREADASLDTFGFELIRHESMVSDWHNLEEIEEKHYAEIRALAKELTCCDFVLFYPAVVRNPEAAKSSEDYNPIEAVHSDYTESYPDVIRDPGHPYHKLISRHFEAEGVSAEDVASASRIRTLQFWRNTGPGDVDYPFAVCDTRSVSRGELFPILVETYGGLETRFESFVVLGQNAAAHEWYSFADMQPDEVLMFRAFDSDKADAGEHFWTPHTAFRNPEATAETPARESIEMRAICFWK